MGKKRPARQTGEKHRFSSQGASRGRSGHGAKSPNRTAPANISPNRRKGFAGGERPYEYSLYESEPATPEYMARLFASHDFPVTDRQLKQFWRYYELLRQHNASLDLTRIMGIEATVLKHFIDSAIILRWFEPAGPVLDIGSGPGFPGVPLAILRPKCHFILAESRGKRVGFLEKVIDALDLRQVEIYPKSVREDSQLGDDYGKPVVEVVTRALETIPPTLERVIPIIRAGGRVAFLKGPGCDEEIREASVQFPDIYTMEGTFDYLLPQTDLPRRLVVFRKASPL